MRNPTSKEVVNVYFSLTDGSRAVYSLSGGTPLLAAL